MFMNIKTIEELKEEYKKFQETFSKYINTDWGNEESDF